VDQADFLTATFNLAEVDNTVGVPQELWASYRRSPQFPLRRTPQLFPLFLFFLFAGFLLFTFVFILFSAFVSHVVSPFGVKWTIFPWVDY